ncbi:unnamed protein product [Rangifer tarandus platyrhynchus]|uniref:Uncharacterized protein n=1 Tax=Rangifer tarandus platyrhynchus TaxID=3082113 RepID=A0ABN8ZGI6_RANTA|nr:unnamed protein product [Rangifer tarandus platyrhynchus]
MESQATPNRQNNLETEQSWNTYTFQNLLFCDPMDCSLTDSSVHGIIQKRILKWVAVPSPGDLPDPGTEPRSPVLEADSLPAKPPGKTPKPATNYSNEEC